ncbi:MAG: hypothetical protein IIY46_03560, partial [Lachnospiraceae bacterium]|nr:hypothetical protein [Lachnospiraceae bacterium]
ADIPVEDNTWEMSGTLSQMALAGVDASEIDKILTEHQANAELKDLTDLQLRDDVAEFYTERQDTAFLPILCMGYYGGWARDPEELVEEYKLLLATYDDPDEFIIYGVCPYVYTDIEAYDKALTDAFGEHYVSFTSLGRPVMTVNNRRAIAEGLFEKMKELGYLS